VKVKKRPKANSRARLKKINHSLYLEPWQSEALAAMSEKTGVPQQVYLRVGLTLLLEQYDTGDSDHFDLLVMQASKPRKHK
jgi:hypothetical protein